MDFHLVITESAADAEPELLYLGKDATQASETYQGQTSGRISHFRLYQTQAYESRDLTIKHVVSRTVPPVTPEPKPPVKASELPGPKPGEIVHDDGTGQDLIRPAANPHQLNVLPSDPKLRAAAIQEAEDYRDRKLETEVAPPDPARAKLIEDELEARRLADRERIAEAAKPPAKVTKKLA